MTGDTMTDDTMTDDRARSVSIEMPLLPPRAATSQKPEKKAHVFCRRSLRLLRARKVLLSLFVTALRQHPDTELGTALIPIASSSVAL